MEASVYSRANAQLNAHLVNSVLHDESQPRLYCKISGVATVIFATFSCTLQKSRGMGNRTTQIATALSFLSAMGVYYFYQYVVKRFVPIAAAFKKLFLKVKATDGLQHFNATHKMSSKILSSKSSQKGTISTRDSSGKEMLYLFYTTPGQHNHTHMIVFSTSTAKAYHLVYAPEVKSTHERKSINRPSSYDMPNLFYDAIERFPVIKDARSEIDIGAQLRLVTPPGGGQKHLTVINDALFDGLIGD